MSGSALCETFSRAPLALERVEGSWLIIEAGERCLDFAGGIVLNSLGHSHQHLVEMLTEQAVNLWRVSNLYQVPGQSRLGECFAEDSFADCVFFVNSGVEVLECVIKTERRYQYVYGQPERYRVITIEGVFHGCTLGTIAARGQAKYLEGFSPKVEGFDQIAFDDIDAAEKLIGPETEAILLEPVQCKGSIRPFPKQSLKRLCQLCDKHSLPLIFDETQCGISRTGNCMSVNGWVFC